MTIKRILGLAMVGILTSFILVGCGQGNSTAPSEEAAELEEMTATFIGLLDGSSFEVFTQTGEPKAIRFSEKDMDELSAINEEVTITFTYSIDENGQYQLEEILQIG